MNLARHYFTSRPADCLAEVLSEVPHDRALILMPRSCSNLIRSALPEDLPYLLIDDREEAKNFDTLQLILGAMLEMKLTRKSLLINAGGGVTTDVGGLAAALYMRGLRYINIPTTLLAMVDASSGGKTAIDFRGVKNCVGAFHRPLTTIISPQFLDTLPYDQLLSGWAEMLKHALLQDDYSLLSHNPAELSVEKIPDLIRESVEFKQRIVDIDPQEGGLRKILNFGHTAGHAFEMHALKAGRAVTHGQAVAQGMVTALLLSVVKTGFPSAKMQTVARAVKDIFPPIPFNCKAYEELLTLMHCDKKNQGDGVIAFTLLDADGLPLPDMKVTDEEVRQALDITRDLLGL